MKYCCNPFFKQPHKSGRNLRKVNNNVISSARAIHIMLESDSELFICGTCRLQLLKSIKDQSESLPAVNIGSRSEISSPSPIMQELEQEVVSQLNVPLSQLNESPIEFNKIQDPSYGTKKLESISNRISDQILRILPPKELESIKYTEWLVQLKTKLYQTKKDDDKVFFVNNSSHELDIKRNTRFFFRFAIHG